MYSEDFMRTFEHQFPNHKWKNIEVSHLRKQINKKAIRDYSTVVQLLNVVVWETPLAT